ncbi:MAG: DUF4340 domain-containing protein [Planctomycetes bacterium]|nr:DUF4340 domain-containing protein [Planctomycetota bacterium]
MSPRNHVLAVLFSALLVLTLTLDRPWRGDEHARTMATVRPLLTQLQRDVEIGRVQIKPSGVRPAVQVEKVFERGQPRWVVPEAYDHPADIEKIGRLIAALRALETRNLESVQVESHATYKLRQGEAIDIQVWSDEDELLAHLMIGALRGQDILDGGEPIVQFYVREAKSSEVYRSDAVYLPPESAARWCDTRFLSTVQEGQVLFLERVDHRGRDSWRIVRDAEVVASEVNNSGREAEASGRWKMVMPESALVPDFAADSWLFTVLGLEAAEVLGIATTPEGVEQFGELRDTFELGLEEGVFRMDLGSVLGDGRRAMRVHGLPHLYAIEDFDAEQLAQAVVDMQLVD